MLRTEIRNRENERVCDALVVGGQVVLEVKNRKQKNRIELEEVLRQVRVLQEDVRAEAEAQR